MEPPSFPAAALQTVRAAPGSSASLCLPLPTGTPPFLYTWSRAGASLDDRFTTSNDAGGVRLAVSAARTGDSGLYTLQASNAAGSSTTKVRLEVSAEEAPTGEDPPTFLRRLQDLTVKVGTRTRFLVEILSSTECKVTWYRNERRLMEAERVALARDGNFWCADVAAVSVDDAGRWTCTAENAGGRASCSAHLNVLVPKAYKRPEFVEELRALLTEQGTVSLECKVVGVPTPVLRWFKDSCEIKAGDVFALTANAEDPTSLGTYTCEAVNCMGRAYSSSKVHVVGHGSREGSIRPTSSGVTPEPPPIFTKELEDQVVRICEPLTLSCQLVVPPWPRSIIWYNKEGKVEPSERYHAIEDGVGGNLLEVVSTEWQDEGEWKCVATSSGGRVGISTCFITMDVPKNYRKPRFMENLQAVLTEEGLVSFECKVVGFPTPVLSWFKDGQELKPGDVYQLTGTNSLGSYCCIAKNCMGQASSSAELTVEDIQNQLNEEEKLQLFSKNQAPKFIQGLKCIEAKIDEPFRFTIKVAIPPEPSVLWYRDDQPVDESSRCHLGKEDRGFFFLDIQNLEFLDQAEWKCVAVNDFGHSVTSCFLKLVIPRHYKKPRFLENLQAILSEEGAVNLECKVIGVPQPILKWYKDGEELKPGDIHRIISGQDGTCCLGTYTCEAQNCMGIAASSASLLGFDDSMKLKKKKAEEQALQRNLSLSTIHEERTSQMYDTPVGDITEDKGEISFSFDGKEVSVSLYETPDLTEEEALQIVEMYADQLSENITEHNVVELPPLRFVKETSTSGNLLMEAIIIDVSPEYFPSHEEDLRTEADVDDISIADENGVANLSLDRDEDIAGEDYLEKTMVLLSEEKDYNFARKKSDSQKSVDDYFSLSREQSLSEEKRDDDTHVMSESDLQSFASAKSLEKAKSKPSKPYIEEGFESSEPTKTILSKDDFRQKVDKSNRRSSHSRRSSSESDKAHNKPKEDPKITKEEHLEMESFKSKREEPYTIEKQAVKNIESFVLTETEDKISTTPNEEFKSKISSICVNVARVINGVQVIEKDIILKSELMSSAATASKSLEIINSLITPLSEINSIVNAAKESVDFEEFCSLLSNNLLQPLKALQQSLTIIEKCIDVEIDNKTLVKKTSVVIIENCGEDILELVNDLDSITKNYLVSNNKMLIEAACLCKEMSSVIKISQDTIKTRHLLFEANTIKGNTVADQHLRETQKAVFELKCSVKSLFNIAESVKTNRIEDICSTKLNNVLLSSMSTAIQDLQSALEQIEILSIKESNLELYKYNTDIIDTVMDSVLKLRCSLEKLSIETEPKDDREAKFNEILDSIKTNLKEVSLHINTIENKIGIFDIMQSENKLDVLQKMARILITLENNLPRLAELPNVKMSMETFHKNFTKVLEDVIESNDESKYCNLIEMCNAINTINSSMKNIDLENFLPLASISNTLQIIHSQLVNNVFKSELNCTLLSNITEALINIQEIINTPENIKLHITPEPTQYFITDVPETIKANVLLEQMNKTVVAINTIKLLESTPDFAEAVAPVLQNIFPILEDIKNYIAYVSNDTAQDEHISEISTVSVVDTLANSLCDLNQNIIVLNHIIIENASIVKDNSEVLVTCAESLYELHKTLEILQHDVISQYNEDLTPSEISKNIASVVQNLQSCIILVQEQIAIDGADDISTLEDVSGIKTTADTIHSDKLIVPSSEVYTPEFKVEEFETEILKSAAADALQTLHEHLIILQNPDIVDALDTLSEVSDLLSLKSVILGLGELQSGIEEIMHPLLLERSNDMLNFIDTPKLLAIAEPMQELQQSLSVFDINSIPVFETVLPTDRIHSVFEKVSSFKEHLDKCMMAIFPAMETADNTIEISNKVGILKEVCEHLKDIIETTDTLKRNDQLTKEVTELRKTIDGLLEATDVCKGISTEQIKSKSEELYDKILIVQEEIIQYSIESSEILAQEVKLIETINEVENNIAVLEQYDFVDLSRASELTSCSSPQFAMELESRSFMEIDGIVENAVNVLQDIVQESSDADLVLVENFFRNCKNQFTILRYIMSKSLNHKKIIRLLQEFNCLQTAINEFKIRKYDLKLNDDVNDCLTNFLVLSDEYLNNLQSSLVKIVELQSDLLFLKPLRNIEEGSIILNEIITNDSDIKQIVNQFIEIIDIARPCIKSAKIDVIEELKGPHLFREKNKGKILAEKMESFTTSIENKIKTANTDVKTGLNKILCCLKKHSNYKNASGTGKILILLKCLSECTDGFQSELLNVSVSEQVINNDIIEEESNTVLTKMLEPLHALHNQLITVQEKIESGADEHSISLDISTTEPLVQSLTEKHKDLVDKIDSLPFDEKEVSLISKMDTEIQTIQESFKAMENVKAVQSVKELIIPLDEVEKTLQTILTSQKKVVENKEIVSKDINANLGSLETAIANFINAGKDLISSEIGMQIDIRVCIKIAREIDLLLNFSANELSPEITTKKTNKIKELKEILTKCDWVNIETFFEGKNESEIENLKRLFLLVYQLISELEKTMHEQKEQEKATQLIQHIDQYIELIEIIVEISAIIKIEDLKESFQIAKELRESIIYKNEAEISQEQKTQNSIEQSLLANKLQKALAALQVQVYDNVNELAPELNHEVLQRITKATVQLQADLIAVTGIGVVVQAPFLLTEELKNNEFQTEIAELSSDFTVSEGPEMNSINQDDNVENAKMEKATAVKGSSEVSPAYKQKCDEFKDMQIAENLEVECISTENKGLVYEDTRTLDCFDPNPIQVEESISKIDVLLLHERETTEIISFVQKLNEESCKELENSDSEKPELIKEITSQVVLPLASTEASIEPIISEPEISKSTKTAEQFNDAVVLAEDYGQAPSTEKEVNVIEILDLSLVQSTEKLAVVKGITMGELVHLIKQYISSDICEILNELAITVNLDDIKNSVTIAKDLHESIVAPESINIEVPEDKYDEIHSYQENLLQQFQSVLSKVKNEVLESESAQKILGKDKLQKLTIIIDSLQLNLVDSKIKRDLDGSMNSVDNNKFIVLKSQCEDVSLRHNSETQQEIPFVKDIITTEIEQGPGPTLQNTVKELPTDETIQKSQILEDKGVALESPVSKILKYETVPELEAEEVTKVLIPTEQIIEAKDDIINIIEMTDCNKDENVTLVQYEECKKQELEATELSSEIINDMIAKIEECHDINNCDMIMGANELLTDILCAPEIELQAQENTLESQLEDIVQVESKEFVNFSTVPIEKIEEINEDINNRINITIAEMKLKDFEGLENIEMPVDSSDKPKEKSLEINNSLIEIKAAESYKESEHEIDKLESTNLIIRKMSSTDKVIEETDKMGESLEILEVQNMKTIKQAGDIFSLDQVAKVKDELKSDTHSEILQEPLEGSAKIGCMEVVNKEKLPDKIVQEVTKEDIVRAPGGTDDCQDEKYFKKEAKELVTEIIPFDEETSLMTSDGVEKVVALDLKVSNEDVCFKDELQKLAKSECPDDIKNIQIKEHGDINELSEAKVEKTTSVKVLGPEVTGFTNVTQVDLSDMYIVSEPELDLNIPLEHIEALSPILFEKISLNDRDEISPAIAIETTDPPLAKAIIERSDFVQHIEDFISSDIVEIVEEISTLSNVEELKETLVVAKELRDSIIASNVQVFTETVPINDIITQQAQLKEKLKYSLSQLHTTALENAQELVPIVKSENLQRISEIISCLQSDLEHATVYTPILIDDEEKHLTRKLEEDPLKQLVSLLKDIDKIIDSPDKTDTDNLRDTLDEVQMVIIKLKKDFDGAGETLNETLEDLECSVRSVQLQINEDSPHDLIIEACAPLQLLVNNMIEMKNITPILEVEAIYNEDILKNCLNEADVTVKLLENTAKINTKDLGNLNNIISCLLSLKDTIKYLKEIFLGDAETLIEKGVDVMKSLNLLEDKLFSIERDVDSEASIKADARDNIVTAIHSVYESMSNMKNTISSIQKKYMFINYGKPSENLLRSIKNIKLIANSEEKNKVKWKKLSKALRGVLNHFEDIKFYINLDKTARLPSDAAFTKIILEELKTNICEVIVSHKLNENDEVNKNVQEVLMCVDKNLQNIETLSVLEVKAKIPMFKEIAAHIYNITTIFKTRLETINDDGSSEKEKYSELDQMYENAAIEEGFIQSQENVSQESLIDVTQESLESESIQLTFNSNSVEKKLQESNILKSSQPNATLDVEIVLAAEMVECNILNEVLTIKREKSQDEAVAEIIEIDSLKEATVSEQIKELKLTTEDIKLQEDTCEISSNENHTILNKQEETLENIIPEQNVEEIIQNSAVVAVDKNTIEDKGNDSIPYTESQQFIIVADNRVEPLTSFDELNTKLEDVKLVQEKIEVLPQAGHSKFEAETSLKSKCHSVGEQNLIDKPESTVSEIKFNASENNIISDKKTDLHSEEEKTPEVKISNADESKTIEKVTINSKQINYQNVENSQLDEIEQIKKSSDYKKNIIIEETASEHLQVLEKNVNPESELYTSQEEAPKITFIGVSESHVIGEQNKKQESIDKIEIVNTKIPERDSNDEKETKNYIEKDENEKYENETGQSFEMKKTNETNLSIGNASRTSIEIEEFKIINQIDNANFVQCLNNTNTEFEIINQNERKTDLKDKEPNYQKGELLDKVSSVIVQSDLLTDINKEMTVEMSDEARIQIKPYDGSVETVVKENNLGTLVYLSEKEEHEKPDENIILKEIGDERPIHEKKIDQVPNICDNDFISEKNTEMIEKNNLKTKKVSIDNQEENPETINIQGLREENLMEKHESQSTQSNEVLETKNISEDLTKNKIEKETHVNIGSLKEEAKDNKESHRENDESEPKEIFNNKHQNLEEVHDEIYYLTNEQRAEKSQECKNYSERDHNEDKVILTTDNQNNESNLKWQFDKEILNAVENFIKNESLVAERNELAEELQITETEKEKGNFKEKILKEKQELQVSKEKNEIAVTNEDLEIFIKENEKEETKTHILLEQRSNLESENKIRNSVNNELNIEYPLEEEEIGVKIEEIKTDKKLLDKDIEEQNQKRTKIDKDKAEKIFVLVENKKLHEEVEFTKGEQKSCDSGLKQDKEENESKNIIENTLEDADKNILVEDALIQHKDDVKVNMGELVKKEDIKFVKEKEKSEEDKFKEQQEETTTNLKGLETNQKRDIVADDKTNLENIQKYSFDENVKHINEKKFINNQEDFQEKKQVEILETSEMIMNEEAEKTKCEMENIQKVKEDRKEKHLGRELEQRQQQNKDNIKKEQDETEKTKLATDRRGNDDENKLKEEIEKVEEIRLKTENEEHVKKTKNKKVKEDVQNKELTADKQENKTVRKNNTGREDVIEEIQINREEIQQEGDFEKPKQITKAQEKKVGAKEGKNKDDTEKKISNEKNLQEEDGNKIIELKEDGDKQKLVEEKQERERTEEKNEEETLKDDRLRIMEQNQQHKQDITKQGDNQIVILPKENVSGDNETKKNTEKPRRKNKALDKEMEEEKQKQEASKRKEESEVVKKKESKPNDEKTIQKEQKHLLDEEKQKKEDKKIEQNNPDLDSKKQIDDIKKQEVTKKETNEVQLENIVLEKGEKIQQEDKFTEKRLEAEKLKKTVEQEEKDPKQRNKLDEEKPGKTKENKIKNDDEGLDRKEQDKQKQDETKKEIQEEDLEKEVLEKEEKIQQHIKVSKEHIEAEQLKEITVLEENATKPKIEQKKLRSQKKRLDVNNQMQEKEKEDADKKKQLDKFQKQENQNELQREEVKNMSLKTEENMQEYNMRKEIEEAVKEIRSENKEVPDSDKKKQVGDDILKQDEFGNHKKEKDVHKTDFEKKINILPEENREQKKSEESEKLHKTIKQVEKEPGPKNDEKKQKGDRKQMDEENQTQKKEKEVDKEKNLKVIQARETIKKTDEEEVKKTPLKIEENMQQEDIERKKSEDAEDEKLKDTLKQKENTSACKDDEKEYKIQKKPLDEGKETREEGYEFEKYKEDLDIKKQVGEKQEKPSKNKEEEAAIRALQKKDKIKEKKKVDKTKEIVTTENEEITPEPKGNIDRQKSSEIHLKQEMKNQIKIDKEALDQTKQLEEVQKQKESKKKEDVKNRKLNKEEVMQLEDKKRTENEENAKQQVLEYENKETQSKDEERTEKESDEEIQRGLGNRTIKEQNNDEKRKSSVKQQNSEETRKKKNYLKKSENKLLKKENDVQQESEEIRDQEDVSKLINNLQTETERMEVGQITLFDTNKRKQEFNDKNKKKLDNVENEEIQYDQYFRNLKDSESYERINNEEIIIPKEKKIGSSSENCDIGSENIEIQKNEHYISEYQYEPRKNDGKEKLKFVDHNYKDYTMDLARPSGYKERSLDKRVDSSYDYLNMNKNATIYKAHTIILDSQSRVSTSPYHDREEYRKDGEEPRSQSRRSKTLSEAKSMTSDKRTVTRDLKRKPVFSTYLTDRTAVEGSRVKLTCSVLSSTDPRITWFKNGIILDNKIKYRNKFIDGLITLEVLNAVPNDSAEYTCTVENENGSVSSSANLKVYPSFEASPIPPTFTRSIRDTYHLAENELVLECRIRGQPLPTITWLKDDKPISLNDRYQAYYLADGVCRLAIERPTPEDSGTYTCKAENSVWSDQISHIVSFTGNESRLSPNLTTLERTKFNRQAIESRRPHFTNVLSDYKVVKGGTIGLQVEIRGSPTHVEWLREGRSVTENYKNARTFVEQCLYTLALSDVTERESGLYTCRAWSNHGNVDMNAAITVVPPNELDGKPATIVGRPEKDILISVGEDVNISFRVQGEPKPKVIFMKGIRDITTNQRVCKMTSDDYVKFTLKRSTVSDAGTYCILARNAYGCDRAFVTVVVRQRETSENLITDWTYPMDDIALSINDRKYKSVPDRIPGEPTVVDGGNNWVSLAWPKPEPGSSAPVLAYKVESWLIGKDGGARWSELGITPLNSFDAFNLKQGEEYHFRVTPRNRYGYGESVQTTTPVGVGLAGDRPEFIDILPGQLKVLTGETANLTCSVKGRPVPEITWMKNGHEIDEEKRMKAFFNGYNCSLTIHNIDVEDEARYSCEASNIHGRSSTYARLAVVTDRLIWEADAKLKRERSADAEGEYPPQFTMRLRDRRVQATYPVRLTCQVVGNPPPTITWFKDAKEISFDSRHNKYQDEHFHTLEIAPTSLDDGGVYEAMARNNCGAVSCRCGLVVDKGIRAYVAPEFCCGLEPLYRLNEGEELRISAVVEAYPSVGVTWYRDGVRLRPSRRAVMTLDRDGQIELALASITHRDAGVYTCTASNEVGRASTSGKVEVTGEDTSTKRTPLLLISPDTPYSKEPMFTRKPRSSEAREGDTVIIACEVVGDPKPDVFWLRDFLKPDYYRDSTHFKRIGDGLEYRFEIPHAKLDYTGAYSVVARNIHGEAKAIISLQIKARDPTSSDEAHNVRYGRVDVIPRFDRNLTDLLSYDGDTVEFECRVTGNPEPDIRWFHYNELIREYPDFESSFEDGAARLKISQVTAEDEGTYTCEASNNLGKATSSACLVVYPPGEPNTLSQRLRRPPALLSAASTPRSTPRSTPARSVSRTPGPELRRASPSRSVAPTFYTYPFNKVAEEGDHVTFQCAVKGLPAPWATWDKDGVIITPTSRITLREKDDIMRILEIEQVTVEDVGVYRITVENEFGRAEASARLEVITRSGKFYAGVRAYSASPRKTLPYRLRPSTSRDRQD